MSRLWTGYWKLLQKYPLRVQMVQTSLIMTGGDVFSQVIIEKRKYRDLDLDRSFKFGFLGIIFVAPAIRGWYMTLDKMFGTEVAIRTTLKKVVVDQFMFSPFFTTTLLTLIGVTQGRNFEAIKVKLKTDLVDIIVTGWQIWPICQFANFYFVPLLIRPLVVNYVAFFWNTYLAWKANRDLQRKKPHS